MRVSLICLIFLFNHNDIYSQTSQENKKTVKTGDRVQLVLTTGASLEGNIVITKKDQYTLLFFEEKISGSLTISNKLVKNIILLPNKKTDFKLIEEKRKQFIASEQKPIEITKPVKPKPQEPPPEETKKKEDDKAEELLKKFSPEKGYGEEKYKEFNSYWIKTGSKPPYLDIRTKAPPLETDIEFYENYSLWKYAFDKTSKK